MLSRLIPSVGRSLNASLKKCVRPSSTAVVTSPRPRDKAVEDWENFKMPLAPYEGMGPLPPIPEWDPKCMRHYLFPEYWFEFLYPRLGVTGPYTLGLGTAAFLVSKEWYIYTPETWTAGCLIVVAYGILTRAGPAIKESMNELEEKHYNTIYDMKMEDIEQIESEVEEIKTEQWRSGIQELYNEVKRSNLAMMLETELLNRKASLVAAVKRKLDYQVAVQEVDRGLAHSHMVNWIEDKVKKSITPESQKKTLDVCIAQLGAMAAK